MVNIHLEPKWPLVLIGSSALFWGSGPFKNRGHTGALGNFTRLLKPNLSTPGCHSKFQGT